MTSPDLDTVLALEERLFNAWPALQTIHFDGWLFRFARGHTKRANAASAWRPSATPVQDLSRAVRSAYRRANLTPMIRITPLAAPVIDAGLEAEGWEVFDRTLVLARSVREPIAMAGAPTAAVVLSDGPSQAWVDGAAEAYALEHWQRDVLMEIVSAIRVDAAFATVILDREPIGYGLAVAERGYVGLYDLAIHPKARSRGLGRRMITSLLHWGRSKGADTAYLQVRDLNERARALYTSLGFQEVYSYHCRRWPGRPGHQDT